MAKPRACVLIACRSSLFDLLDFNVYTVTDLTAIAMTGGQQLPRFFRRFSLDAPLLHACDVHGGLEGLERGFLF